MAIAAAVVATAAATLSHLNPAQRLYQQTQRLEAGDYTARSAREKMS